MSLASHVKLIRKELQFSEWELTRQGETERVLLYFTEPGILYDALENRCALYHLHLSSYGHWTPHSKVTPSACHLPLWSLILRSSSSSNNWEPQRHLEITPSPSRGVEGMTHFLLFRLWLLPRDRHLSTLRINSTTQRFMCRLRCFGMEDPMVGGSSLISHPHSSSSSFFSTPGVSSSPLACTESFIEQDEEKEEDISVRLSAIPLDRVVHMNLMWFTQEPTSSANKGSNPPLLRHQLSLQYLDLHLRRWVFHLQIPEKHCAWEGPISLHLMSLLLDQFPAAFQHGDTTSNSQQVTFFSVTDQSIPPFHLPDTSEKYPVFLRGRHALFCHDNSSLCVLPTSSETPPVPPFHQITSQNSLLAPGQDAVTVFLPGFSPFCIPLDFFSSCADHQQLRRLWLHSSTDRPLFRLQFSSFHQAHLSTQGLRLLDWFGEHHFSLDQLMTTRWELSRLFPQYPVGFSRPDFISWWRLAVQQIVKNSLTGDLVMLFPDLSQRWIEIHSLHCRYLVFRWDLQWALLILSSSSTPQFFLLSDLSECDTFQLKQLDSCLTEVISSPLEGLPEISLPLISDELSLAFDQQVCRVHASHPHEWFLSHVHHDDLTGRSVRTFGCLESSLKHLTLRLSI